MYKCSICKRQSKPKESCAQIYTPKKKLLLCPDCYEENWPKIKEDIKAQAYQQWTEKFQKEYNQRMKQVLINYANARIEGIEMSRIFKEYKERGKDYVFSKLDKSDMSEEQKTVAKVAIYSNLALQGEMDYRKAIYEINNVLYVHRNRNRKKRSD